MAAKISRKMVYESDIKRGGKNNDGKYDLSFTTAAGYDDCIPSDVYTTDDGKCICSPSGLFTPRYVVAKFAATPSTSSLTRNCAILKLDVPKADAAMIKSFVDKLKECGAICVDYVGESWNAVPPKIGDYTPTFTPVFALTVGVQSRKVSGVNVEYTSEALGDNQVASVIYEAQPFQLTSASIANGKATPGGAFKNCHGDLVDGASCGSASTLSPRLLVVGFRYTAPGSTVEKRGRRQVTIPKFSDLLNCIKNLGDIAGVNCIGYEGETVKRVDLLV